MFKTLEADIKAVFDRDPAARSTLEVIFRPWGTSVSPALFMMAWDSFMPCRPGETFQNSRPLLMLILSTR